MNAKNEATVANLIKKRNEDELKEAEEEAEEEEKKFKPGQYDIPPEMSLVLENVALKLELVARDKHALEGERHRAIDKIKTDLGVPDDMKVVGGTADFKKIIVEKRED